MKHSSRPRATVELPKRLHEQLNIYALAAGAAGVGLLALAQPAQAEIVYTPAYKKLHLNQYFFLDLNHDGVNDFKFFIHSSRSSHGCTAKMGLYRLNRGNGAAGKTSGLGDFFASALKAGVRIGKSQDFPNQSWEPMALEAAYFDNGSFQGSWASSSRPVDHRYLGLKFVFGGRVHYGWARFNVWMHDCAVSATLTGYAYETIPTKRQWLARPRALMAAKRNRVPRQLPHPGR